MNIPFNQSSFEDRAKERASLFRDLFAEKGITEFVMFGGSGEGKKLPGGMESESGAVLSSDGKVYRFWLDWDDEKTAPDGSKGYYTLGENDKIVIDGVEHSYFEEKDPKEYENDSSYISARKKLGLPLTPEQQEILDKETRR